MTRNDLRRWAQSLQNEGRELGDTLMRYAEAWDAECERLRELLILLRKRMPPGAYSSEILTKWSAAIDAAVREGK